MATLQVGSIRYEQIKVDFAFSIVVRIQTDSGPPLVDEDFIRNGSAVDISS